MKPHLLFKSDSRNRLKHEDVQPPALPITQNTSSFTSRVCSNHSSSVACQDRHITSSSVLSDDTCEDVQSLRLNPKRAAPAGRKCPQACPKKICPVPCAARFFRIRCSYRAATAFAGDVWSVSGRVPYFAAAPSAGEEPPRKALLQTGPSKTCAKPFCWEKAREMHLDPTSCAGDTGRSSSSSVWWIRSPFVWFAKPQKCTKVTTALPQKRRLSNAR